MKVGLQTALGTFTAGAGLGLVIFGGAISVDKDLH